MVFLRELVIQFVTLMMNRYALGKLKTLCTRKSKKERQGKEALNAQKPQEYSDGAGRIWAWGQSSLVSSLFLHVLASSLSSNNTLHSLSLVCVLNRRVPAW